MLGEQAQELHAGIPGAAHDPDSDRFLRHGTTSPAETTRPPVKTRRPFETGRRSGGHTYAGLALGELLAASRLVEADLLALDFACVTRDQARLLQHGLQRLVVIDQR